jgi:hypothetical protein
VPCGVCLCGDVVCHVCVFVWRCDVPCVYVGVEMWCAMCVCLYGDVMCHVCMLVWRCGVPCVYVCV